MSSSAQGKLNQRYGRTGLRLSRKASLSILAAVVVVGLAFLAWASFGKGPTAEVKFSGYTVVDATQTTAEFQVTKDPQRSAQCEVQALDNSFTVVGYKVVTIPATDGARTTGRKVNLNTDALAVTAQVETCWIS